MRGAFDFGRVFFFKWTVNWKFLDESVFVSKELAVLLLATHLSLLVFYLHRYACQYVHPLWHCYAHSPMVSLITILLCARCFCHSSEGGLFRFIGKLVSGLTKPRLPSPQFIVTALFFGNFLGVMCARSLHYQFYSWVFFSLPYLLWQTTLPVVVRFVAAVASIQSSVWHHTCAF
jgi:alpha-1,3-mannosyltransferase